jgi:hypothetical protein
MELDAEGKSDFSARRLRTSDDVTALVYEMPFEAVGAVE